MVESAALLVDEILPQQPMRQWVLSVPFQPIAKRIGRYLERQGLLERDAEHGYLNANAIEDEQDPMHQRMGLQ